MPEVRQLLLIVSLLAMMGVAGALGTRHRGGAVLLALTGFVWLLVDTGFEGRTIWTVSPTHGLTTTDLVGLAGMLVAALELVMVWRRGP